VKTKFEEHFVVRRNVIFERAKFNQRRKEDGEMVDPKFTLTKAMHQARQSEAVKRQQILMKNDFKEPAEVGV